jgi:hypothetical protein
MDIEVGDRFGRLEVTEVVGKRLECRCDCGETPTMYVSHFTNDSPRRSCGCIRRERRANRSTQPVKFHEGPVELGQRYGKLTVVALDTKPGTKRAQWLCKCDCGGEVYTQAARLLKKRRTSCGCKHVKGGNGTYRTTSPERTVWWSMRQRCNHPGASHNYGAYGGRGIKVCDRWEKSFEAFMEDMGPRPTQDHQLDREDNDGNYEPGNCRWVTRKVNNNNRRTNRRITYKGETKNLREWAAHIGISDTTLYDRLARGIPMEEVMRKGRAKTYRCSKCNQLGHNRSVCTQG